MASREEEVGIWALRARLSFYLERVEQGREVVGQVSLDRG
jgi:hypothetical protein